MVLGLLPLFHAGAATAAEEAYYRVVVDVWWSEATHPGACPPEAHLSWLAGATHTDVVSLWEDGALASAGMVQLAETGMTSGLELELHQVATSGAVDTVLAWRRWFCPQATESASCGGGVLYLSARSTHPYLSLASMLGPSPDWFVGLSSLQLFDGVSWLEDSVIELVPFDAGTRERNEFELFGPLTLPPKPISAITDGSGQIIGPAALGSLTLERISLHEYQTIFQDGFEAGDAAAWSGSSR